MVDLVRSWAEGASPTGAKCRLEMHPSGSGRFYLAFHRPLATYRGEDLQVFPEAWRDLMYGGTQVIATGMFTAEFRCDGVYLHVKATRNDDGVTCFEATFDVKDVSYLFEVLLRERIVA